MNKLDAILKILSEDSVDGPSTSVMPSSPAAAGNPPTNTEFTTIADLLKYKTGMDIGENKVKILGVPLQNILEELVSLYMQARTVEIHFKDAAENNPVYRDRPGTAEVFERVQQSIRTIQTQIKAVTKELDNLSLES